MHIIIFLYGVLDSTVVSALDCRPRGRGFNSPPGQKFGSRFLLHKHPLADSAMMSTLTNTVGG